ncbi:hypothetical protein BDV93DRAFT_608300 [Ceratobasidium sp. AG-I]|nr:hypothetical protein BDV93DRAFT_608300 [Ceratobasidium sp. AG-I]
MITTDKSDMGDSHGSAFGETHPSVVRRGSSRDVDNRSVMTVEPPPFARSGLALLSSPPPTSIQSGAHPARSSSQHASPNQATYSQARLFADLPPSPRTRTRSLGDKPQPSYSFASTMGGPSVQHSPPPPPQPVFTPSRSLTSPIAEPVPGSSRPRNYNYLIQRNDNSVRGAWFINTAIDVPEALRPPAPEYSGFWNEMDKKSIKQREKEKKKREGGGWGRKKTIDNTPPKPLANAGTRPNLMLITKDGSIQADVNVVSGDGVVRMAVVVAESKDGSVKLNVNAAPELPLRVFAISMDGSVRVRVPPTFEGALSLTALDGIVHISEGIKARLMAFSVTNKSMRCYVGNWQAANFGVPSPFSSESLPSTCASSSSVSHARFPDEVFGSWTGPLAHLYSRDGSVHISYIGEDTSGIFSKAMRSIKNGIMGTGSEEKRRSQDWIEVDGHRAPREDDMQGYRRPPTGVLEHLRERYPKDPRVGYFANESGQAEHESEYTPRLSEGEMDMQDPMSPGDYWLDEQGAGPSHEPHYGFRSSPPEWPHDCKGSDKYYT